MFVLFRLILLCRNFIKFEYYLHVYLYIEMFKTFLFTNILFPFQSTNDDRSPNYLCIFFVFVVVVFMYLVVIQFTQLYSTWYTQLYQHNMLIMCMSLKPVDERSNGFLGVIRFPSSINLNWPPRYNWDIVESDVKDHKTNLVK
jgi:hypothetical protein